MVVRVGYRQEMVYRPDETAWYAAYPDEPALMLLQRRQRSRTSSLIAIWVFSLGQKRGFYASYARLHLLLLLIGEINLFIVSCGDTNLHSKREFSSLGTGLVPVRGARLPHAFGQGQALSLRFVSLFTGWYEGEMPASLFPPAIID